MRSQNWTVERVDLLRRLWSEGATAAVIGARLGGMSRSAVLGKVFRLRLGSAASALAKRKLAASDQSDKAGVPARRRRGGKRKKPQQGPPARIGQRKTLCELTNTTCRWPVGRPGTEKFHFCGALGANLERGVPYCARHMRRAYPVLADMMADGSLTAPRGRSRRVQLWA